MALLSPDETRFARLIDELIFENPFRARRVELEEQALGSSFRKRPDAWRQGPGHRNENLSPLLARVSALLERHRCGMSQASAEECTWIRSLVRYKLYYEFDDRLLKLSQRAERGNLASSRVASFAPFRAEYRRLMEFFPEGEKGEEIAHLFALCFQIRRAFEHLFLGIIGASEPAAALRAQVWESIFTHDMRRYERSLYGRMHHMNTLIVGPSGTGKELVARAIGESRYIPFDHESERFVDETRHAFFPLNLSALAPGLVESELFGHKKGSFTGAISDHAGVFEACPAQGTVFLDEIGELSPDLQVKLLRTLQVREVRRVGEHENRPFLGKLISATNRDLGEAVRQGKFREDFYYRLRADQIETPSLDVQLRDCPQDLARLVHALVARFVPPTEVESMSQEVLTFLDDHLANYHWPGNVRELEQAILSLIVHGRYTPEGVLSQGRPTRLGERLLQGRYSLDELADLYVTLSYERYGSYVETARHLELDRRTVKARVRPELLDF